MPEATHSTQAYAQAEIHRLIDLTRDEAIRGFDQWARDMHASVDTGDPLKVVSRVAGLHMMLGNLLTGMSISNIGTRLEMWIYSRAVEETL